MNLALLQAYKNLGNTKENPSVGCVITKDNSLISAGNTSINGRPHAEQNAINFSKSNLKNSELYVTLEPCSNYGKTPPCTKLIAKKGIKKVFYSINDPDSRSKNKCAKFLREKNITVFKGLSSKKLNFFYRSYIKSRINDLPFVTCKLAVSKDFFMINKKNKWITNVFSRSRVHLMRSNHDCILTSCKTIMDDNSQMTCRINGLQTRSPSRIILDSKLKISLNSKIIKDAKSYETIIFYSKFNKKKIRLLKKLKVNTFKTELDLNNNLDLTKVLLQVKKLGFNRIFLECGMNLAFSFLNNNLIDDLKLFISNKKLGQNGKNNIKKKLNLFTKGKSPIKEKVNLFGDKLLSFSIK